MFIKNLNLKFKGVFRGVCGRVVKVDFKTLAHHLPLTAVGSNPDRDFAFFHVRKLSS
jgi:hypothetical protein